RRQADAANLAKSEFLSNMSHELRTPLNAILGFAQLLEFDPDQALSDSQQEAVVQIMNGGNHLLRLIGEVLDLSKIETGNISLSIERVEVGAVLADLRAALEPLAAKASLKLV